MSFKIGDTVYLKSGGPLMTVRSLLDHNQVVCVWFRTGEEQTTSDVFDTRTIEYSEVPET